MATKSIEDAMEWARGGQFKDVLRREIIRLRKIEEAAKNRHGDLCGCVENGGSPCYLAAALALAEKP